MTVPTTYSRYDTLGLPPDSTGKKLALQNNIVISFVGNNVDLFAEGQIVTGGTSAFTGTVTGAGAATIAGGLLVLLSHAESAPDIVTAGEQLIVGGIPYGTVIEAASVHVPMYGLVSGDNPFNAAKIDSKGSQFVRYSEGDQQLDAFGLSRFTTPTPLATYTFINGIDAEEWHQQTVASGLITNLVDESAVALDADVGATSVARIITHRNHIYHPGEGMVALMTVLLGDSGKTNNVRRWGLFDDNDGVFFQVSGTTLAVGVRSSVTGSPVDTIVPQSSWNIDKIDGALGPLNISAVDLDITKLNLFWIDYQWLGAGRVRFGIYHDGARLTAHVMNHGNAGTTAWMSRPTLPFTAESFNTGITVSPSRLKMVCAQASVDGVVHPVRERRTQKWTVESTEFALDDTDGQLPIVSFRSKTLLNTRKNKKVTILEKISVRVTGSAVIIRIRRNVALTGSVFVPVSNAAGEYDVTATAYSDLGEAVIPYILEPGSYDLALPGNFGMLSENMRLFADDTQEIWSISGQVIDAGTTDPTEAEIMIFATWIDVGS